MALKCDSSRTRTERELLSLLIPDSATSSLPLNAAIQNVVDRNLNKFKKLSDPNELKRFYFICQEKFRWGNSKVIPNRTCAPDQSVSQYEEMEVDKAVTVAVMPIPISPIKTRQISKCSSC
ncbi:hypothetical protein LSH36_230g00009 [Paralvinella palmiformis]|uniref:Uncharacterized protein n=1 Tax=Paralvinella palmiformis TaxID=53620 RepID=A0AAD9JN66_9ANNE|nr:hypothetical protein LSH36_230g00009 [Paralvinella palmiformis]